MTQQLFHLSPTDYIFPPCHFALKEPDGLLAIGGCLNTLRLKKAYQQGIFPWFNEREPIMWWSPSERGILALEDFHIGRTLKKAKNRLNPRVTINHAFEQVISQCRTQRLNEEGTWINKSMLKAYCQAHKEGFAHSVEVWVDNQLVGGLYGIMVSGVFCGESMFHNLPNTSKLAMWALVNWLKKHNAHFIDCQLDNPYLSSMGAKVIPREEFLTKLKEASDYHPASTMWLPQDIGAIYD
ncbi:MULTISPECIES: leucyl/phenylalanyl-tRNA--protein transferase [Pseudoalteromonas]|uniref:Leucyl/phenylalanyl-tRNA--protein transferase n=1 Tax=Pseudoalteromonas luteoviolacea (strain 2ta16) TaxID=1353533 RepID=V4J6V8_PSEL2|nr:MULTISPECIES: leucyl/phenylalanyl-tRNA--protein transferase [Pseudoalteromonas]ESP91037.1 leucyl/phenylalanyl-tRNA--protein transferase [Pseudoalteromonas luteoviolacea 2ta16]KZN38206.1 leucyl/phenylalanyl-tRNA--protein transferase [Pseudoalteromonas luteoviolacea NCIMB 1944]MCG7547638.1 leucyl/phenylalanyl-tRNA--protein transferase [Pseudoalteromonas sp. Of7M-16]